MIYRTGPTNKRLKENDIDWNWPSKTIQKRRIKFFTKSLESKEIVEILSPDSSLKRKLGRPKFRMIDAILNDIEDLEIIGMDQNFSYTSLTEIFGLKMSLALIHFS